jgi:competence protein ComEC
MSPGLYKILAVLGIVFILALVAAVWSGYGLAASSEKPLEVDFLDIGQGDSILIKTPFGQNILIDGGPDNSVIRRLGENLPFWDRTIDLMILTHPHDDHVSGLVEVLQRYQVKKILYSGVNHTSPSYLAWLAEIKKRKISVVIVNRQQIINLGPNCRLEILSPRQNLVAKTVENLNNTSIVARLVYQQAKFLFTGDAEKEEEDDLLATGADLSTQVLKVCHHGSNTSSGEKFLAAVRPQIAVIQVGADNQFGFPSRRVLKRLEKIGIKVYRTDRDGTVKIITDGQNFKVATREKNPLSLEY